MTFDPLFQDPPKKKKKIKINETVNGQEIEREIEVDDVELSWGPNNAHTLLNKRITRVDGPQKVSGAAVYTHDVRLPGMLYGRVLHSPHAHAEVGRIDASAAEKMPGVKAVIVFSDKKEVKYEGDPVAAVAAISPEIAEDAVRAIKVRYRKLPHVVTAEQARQPNAPQVYEKGLKNNARPQGENGDRPKAEAAFAASEVKVEAEFTCPMQHHVCLETHGVTVDYRGGDTATVYASTQGTFTIPGEAAGILGLKENAVTSVVEYMGGGFGSKFGLMLPGQIACQLSKKAQAPVKLMLTRHQEYIMGGNREGAWIKVKAGASKDGKLTGFVSEVYRLGGLNTGSGIPLPYIYNKHVGGRAPDKTYAGQAGLHTHQDANVAMRGPGHPQASFVMESLMDELADRIGMDPIAFRKANTDDPAYHRQLDAGAKAIGWERRNAKPGAGPASGPFKSLKRGIGCGCATWGGGGNPASCVVDITIQPEGGVTVQVGTQDLGTGSRTYTAAIVAEELGLPVSAVQTRIGRSTYGKANPSGGSTTTASLAPAVKDAAMNARNLLFGKVAPLLLARPEELDAKDGRVFVKADPNKTLAWAQACKALGSSPLQARGGGTPLPGLGGNGVHGAQFAEVEVDTDTGKVRVVKMVAVQDCGLPLNRLALESQMNGGMIQMLGYALLEDHHVDDHLGNMMNAMMDQYKVPGCAEMPELVPMIDDGDTRTQVIGMAEPVAIPGAAAIANAVSNAIGVRITSLPITPDKVLNALAKKKA